MEQQPKELTKKQRISLIIVGIVFTLGLFVYLAYTLTPHNKSSKTTTTTYTDPASKQEVVTGGPVKSAVQGADTSSPSFIGFDDMTTCGMTQYNISAFKTALSGYAPFKNTIINLYVDDMSLQYDSTSSNPPVCTIKIKVNPEKSYPKDPTDYTVVDILDDINTAHITLKSDDRTVVYSSQLVTAKN